MTHDCERHASSEGKATARKADVGDVDTAQQRALDVARDCAGRLRQEFQAANVILFGSLAAGCFVGGSDIDLGVEGMEFRQYLKSVAELSFVGGFRVDVVHLDFCSPRLRERARREGILLA